MTDTLDIKNSADQLNDQLHEHPLFKCHVDPTSSVSHHVLHTDIAPLIRAGYFATPSIRANSRYLWFYAAYPPSKHLYLGVMDLNPDSPTIKVFPHIQRAANFLVHPDGNKAWCAVDDGIYLVDIDGGVTELFRFPSDIRAGRHLYRLATSLTLSADGQYFLLDSQVGNRWIIGLVNAHTGEYKHIHEFAWDHHHAMFSLHDPTLFMINHAPGMDPITGQKYNMNVRIWLMRSDLTMYQPMDPKLWFGHNSNTCHEWWTTSGKIHYCEYNTGIWENDPSTGNKALIWAKKAIHGQTSPCERFIVSDYHPYKWNENTPCSVSFFDRETKLEAVIADRLPEPGIKGRDRRTYHLDPHPQFSEDGQIISYGSTLMGRQSIALVTTQQAIAALR